MIEFLQAIPFSFAALFPVLNPFGSALIFLSLTTGLTGSQQTKLCWKIALNTFSLLVIVLLTGSWILRLFGITLPIVQVAGGLLVAYIGWTLLNKDNGKTTTVVNSNYHEVVNQAFYPLTMPITAGPGCIAVTLAIGAHEMGRSQMYPKLGLLGAIVGIMLASLVVFLSYRYAYRLSRRLGPARTQVIMKLAAFINLCIGLEIMWHGIRALALLLRT